MPASSPQYLLHCADRWEEVSRHPNRAGLAEVERVARLYERSHFAEAEFLRQTLRPDRFRIAAARVRHFVRADEIERAREEVDRFNRNLDYARSLFLQRLALTGLNQHRRVDRMRDPRNENVQRETKLRHDAWQREAERVWACNPSWGRPAVAKRVAAKLGGKPDTIRKAIKKSGIAV
jgi:hypothetical protein